MPGAIAYLADYAASPSNLFWMACLAGTTFVCFRRGGPAERWGAAAAGASWLATFAVVTVLRGPALQIGMLACDGALLAWFLGTGVVTRGLWPFAAAAFLALGLLLHLAFDLTGHEITWGYFVGLQAPSYMVLAALALGAWTRRQAAA